MYTDGITLLAASEITREQVEENRGTVLPSDPSDGQEFELVVGEDSTLHVYAAEVDQWFPLTNLSKTPYDIGLTIFDRPRSSDIVCKHLAARNFKLNPNFEHSLAIANVAATEPYTLDIFRVATDHVTETKIGELFFAANATIGVLTPTIADVQMIFVRGQTLMIRSPEVRDATLKSMDVTIVGELLIQGVSS